MTRFLITALIAILSAGAAMASCAPREIVAERLAEKYGERMIAGGLQGADGVTSLIEIWVSEETGTFTVLATSPQGISCMIAAGANWGFLPASSLDPDA